MLNSSIADDCLRVWLLISASQFGHHLVPSNTSRACVFETITNCLSNMSDNLRTYQHHNVVPVRVVIFSLGGVKIYQSISLPVKSCGRRQWKVFCRIIVWWWASELRISLNQDAMYLRRQVYEDLVYACFLYSLQRRSRQHILNGSQYLP